MTNMRYAWQALTLSYESNMCLAEYQQLPRSFPWPRPAMDPLSGNDDLYVWLPCPMHSAHCPFFAGDWTDSFENKIDCSLNFGSLDCVRTESCNFQEGRLKRLALNGDCTKGSIHVVQAQLCYKFKLKSTVFLFKSFHTQNNMSSSLVVTYIIHDFRGVCWTSCNCRMLI